MSETVEIHEELALEELTKEFKSDIQEMDARNRCDRCSSQAFVATVFEGGLRLDWCGHHWKMHRDALSDLIIDYKDELYKLNVPKENTVHA
jgi:hypothetical protein